MSTYVTLGSKVAKGAEDTTGLNEGNWTVTFGPAALGATVPFFEACKIVIAGAAGSTAVIQIDNRNWDYVQRADANSWEAGDPMPLTPGQTVYFFWSDPVSDDIPPEVTMWLRYDLEIPANQAAAPGTQAVA